MASAAPARRNALPAYEAEPRRARPAARRAPQAQARAAQRARLTHLFVIFAVCLTVLAVGRVALSFAVVQKSLQTDTVVSQERALSAENARLNEDLAQLASSVRIRTIAERDLGLVDADHVQYLMVPHAHGKAPAGH